MTMLIFDGHLDLAMNAVDWNRNLALPVAETRAAEAGMSQKGRARGTVAYPEMRRGSIGLCLATVLARVAQPGNPLPGFSTPAAAYAHAQAHLAYYRARQRDGTLRMIKTRADLGDHLSSWADHPESAPLGFMLTMEGADPVLEPEQLHEWQAQGLRAIGLVHYGKGRYAHGTHTVGGLTDLGRALLPEIRRAGLVLDLTHTADGSFWEAVEAFDGPIQCSHQNCRVLAPDQRQMDDDQLKAVIARGGVIGAALDAWMVVPGWVRGVTTNECCSLEHVALHIDRVCQLAGNSLHAAIGSDLDGGFGTEQCPGDLDTIADLQHLEPLLRAKGYGDDDVRNIFHANLVRLFQQALPD